MDTQQEQAEVIQFSPAQPRHCVFCGEMLEEETEGSFDEECMDTMESLNGLDRLIGDEPKWDKYHTAISNADILLIDEDNEVEASAQRILLGLSQGLEPDAQQQALSALKHLGFGATASHIGSTLCVEGYSASQEPAYLTFEENELRLSCEPRKKASKLLREDLNGEWVDTDRIFVFSADRDTALGLLRVFADWYPLVQFNDEFLLLVDGEEFVEDDDDNEPDPEPDPEPEDNPEPEAFGEGLREGTAELVDEQPEEGEEEEECCMQTAEDLDQDLFVQVLAKTKKPLTRKAFRELIEMSSKYDLALAELAPEDIKDTHLARLWEIYMASVGTALVADIAIDQYLADRKAASESAGQQERALRKRRSSEK